MKFKKILFALMIFILSVMAVGCGNSSNNASNSNSMNKTNQTAAAQAGNTAAEKISMPQGRPALIGKVKDIVGNEVTIYKAQANENQSQSQSQTSQGTKSRNRGPAMKFSEQTETLLITVGAPIVTGFNEGTQVGLAGIKEDAILRIWKQGDTITFVQVMSSSGSSQRNNDTGTTRSQNGNGTGGFGGPGFGDPGMGGAGSGTGRSGFGGASAGGNK